jgi:putative PIG3 family NAD(P)H quinone oxidoreductase
MVSGLPDTMRAVEITSPGGPEVLRATERPLPVPGPRDVLVEVAAAGVNRPDILQRQGHYAPPPGVSDVPGLEIAGRVVAAGKDVDEWAVDDLVCALVGGGGYAEYCSAPAGQCLPLPAGLDLVQAAALPETVFTVWANVFERGRLSAGDSLLVHGGSGGIGTMAIQMARARGVRVFATAGSPDKCAACERLGAEHAIDYRREDFAAVIQERTSGRGVDVILDMVGGDYLPRNIASLATEGRLVQIAYLRGSRSEIDLAPILQRRLTLTGSTLRARPLEEKARLAHEVRANVWPLVEAGAVRPVVHATFPLAEAAAAHRLMESGTLVGKIVLLPRA